MIEPVDITRPVECFTISGKVSFDLFAVDESYCTVGVKLFDGDKAYLKTIDVGLTPQDVASWGDDDEVLIEIIKTKCGWTEVA